MIEAGVARLARILIEVEQLAGTEPPRAQQTQRPFGVQGLLVGLGVGHACLGRARPGQERAQVAPTNARRSRHGERRQDGRQQIDGLNHLGHALGLDAGAHDHEGHPHLLFVNGAAMVPPAVIAELFAVVGGDDGDAIPGAVRIHQLEQLAHRRVGRGNLRSRSDRCRDRPAQALARGALRTVRAGRTGVPTRTAACRAAPSPQIFTHLRRAAFRLRRTRPTCIRSRARAVQSRRNDSDR